VAHPPPPRGCRFHRGGGRLSPRPRWFPWFVVAWLALALEAGLSGRVAQLRPPAPQLLAAGLTLALVALGRGVPGLRAWLRDLDPRTGIALHVTRFVGAIFLLDYQRGLLPIEFAAPAGLGDIAVASMAVGLLLAPASPRWTSFAFFWNLFGLADILFVVLTAARLSMRNPMSMEAMLHPPLSLLPTFLVPWIIASHLWLFGRLRGGPTPETRPA